MFVAVSPDGRHLVATGFKGGTGPFDFESGGDPRVWDIETGKSLASLTGVEDVAAVAFTPSGRWILGAGRHDLFASPSPWAEKPSDK